MNAEPARGCIEVLDHITHVLSASGQARLADELHCVRAAVSDALLTGLALVCTITRSDRDPTFEEIDLAVRAHVHALTKCSGDDEKRTCPDKHSLHHPISRRPS